MITAIMIGSKSRKGFIRKNNYKVLDSVLCEFSLIAAKKSKLVDKIYVATNCDKISTKYKIEFIDSTKKPTNFLDFVRVI